MSLFTSVFRQLSACFTPSWGRRLSPQIADIGAEAGESKAMSTQKHRKVKSHHGHRPGKEGEGLKDQAEEEKQALSAENIQSTEREGGNGEPGGKKRKRRKLKNKKTLPLPVEVKPLPAPACFSSSPPVGDQPEHPDVLALPAAGLKPLLKDKESLPRLVEVKPLPASACFSSLTPVGDQPEHPEVLVLPASHLKALSPLSNPASRPQSPVEETDEVLPSSVIQVAPCVSPEPVLLPLQSSSEVASLCSIPSFSEPSLLQSPPETLPIPPIFAFDEVVSLVKPQASECSPSSGLMLFDFEDEELEFMEYTEEDIEAFYESEMKPRRMAAWLEQEEVTEVQKDGGKGASQVIQNPLNEVSRDEAFEELLIQAFCTGPPVYTEIKSRKKPKRNGPLVLFSLMEEKVKKKQEKKLRKEEERNERNLLRERYRNDPKLKHLCINKHNPNFCWS
ncbi:uncharacterized protein si:ch211-255a21.2 [Danio rerio]|uniref:Si:ch211-255a21.2 n=1 Tax=Danio rerio TaxID=7955 RepID=E9QCD2_DANRE|nr:uncharacterized protein si:ch211-255a21.2 [Danio rerio]|eukprot:XP_001336743.1 uncharacterized protein si:ch211-255a21.2 [Danio rerio]